MFLYLGHMHIYLVCTQNIYLLRVKHIYYVLRVVRVRNLETYVGTRTFQICQHIEQPMAMIYTVFKI